MSKQIKNEELKNEVVESEMVEVETNDEPIEEESKAKKLWAKVKKPITIGAVAIGGFILGKMFSSKDDNDVVYEYDPEDEEVDNDEAEE